MCEYQALFDYKWRETMVKNKSVIAINVSVFLLMVGVGLIVALLPQRIMNLSSSVSDVGLLASAYAIPNVLLQIPIGNLSDRLGFKSFLAGGYLLSGLTGFLYFFADTPNLYFGGRFLQGIAEVPIWALAPALLSIQYASDKGKFMGIYNASLHCGLTAGGLMSIIILKLLQGNEAFLLFAVMGILGGLITILFVENPNQTSADKATAFEIRGIWSLLANRTNLIVFSGITLYGAGYGIFITIVPAFLISARGVSQTTIGVFFAFFYLALSLSQLFSGTWSDRKGRKPAMIAGLLIAAFGIAAFHKCRYPLFIVFLATASLGLGMFCVSSMAFLNERVSKSLKGTISGAFYFSWGAGYFFGPLLMGRIGTLVNFQAGFSLFSCLMIAQVLAIIIFVKGKRHFALY
jgi:MFS family permease